MKIRAGVALIAALVAGGCPSMGCQSCETSREESTAADAPAKTGKRKEAPPPPKRSGATPTSIAVGSGYGCALYGDGAVWCWGSNRLGSVGVESPGTAQYHAKPVRVPLPPVTQLAAAGISPCFEDKGGRVACWGGGLRDGDAHPSELALPPGGRFAGGPQAHCVIDKAGAATCWGDDSNGRLSPGDASRTDATLDERKLPPTRLALEQPVTDVAIGGRHACALHQDGRVACWGLNNFGQLGRPGDDTAIPEIVAGLSGITRIAAGYFFTCALDKAGAVWCWGRAEDGQLGGGPVTLRDSLGDKVAEVPVPAKVKGLTGVRALACGSSTSCAIAADKTLWCWGDNDEGQVGDGTSEDRFEPVQIAGLADVEQVAPYERTTCALANGGGVYCWGDNDDGKLGNGGVEASAVPVEVLLPSAVPAPPAKAAELVEYESLACGFRVKLPGERVYRELSDLRVDQVDVADTGFMAACTRRNDMADKDPEALRARFPKAAPVEVDGAPCVKDTGFIGCFTREEFISVHAKSADAALVDEVIGSLELFDKRDIFVPTDGVSREDDDMLAVPAGEFAMGCENRSLFGGPVGELGCTEKSQPLHRVKLPAYAIDRTEVTWAAYQSCVEAGSCTAAAIPSFQRPTDHPGQPVHSVTWAQADAFCAWKKKRLPSEAEWEKAARGTDGRSRPWGQSGGSCTEARILQCSGAELDDVGSHPAGASPYGVLDMVGNVEEWTADHFEKSYYLKSPVEDPRGPKTGLHRAIRGGHRLTDDGSTAVYHRHGREPSFQSDTLGFRCARSL